MMSAGPINIVQAMEPDDAGLRDMARTCVMDGSMRISLEREPNFFTANERLGGRHDTLIARDQNNQQIIGTGSRVLRTTFLDGEERETSYLYGLRLHPSYRGSVGVLRRGYDSLKSLDRTAFPICLTSIAAENRRARALLEAGLSGFPRYHKIGTYVTLAMTTIGRRHSSCAPNLRSADWSSDQVQQLNAILKARDFAPVISDSEVKNWREHSGLSPLFLVSRGNDTLALGAVWDQRAFKQIRVHSYTPWLHVLRPLVNLASRLMRLPQLPQPGAAIESVYLSFFHAVNAGAAHVLIDAAMFRAGQIGASILLLGLPASHPLMTSIARRYRARCYATHLYLVSWAEDALPKIAFPWPEASLL